MIKHTLLSSAALALAAFAITPAHAHPSHGAAQPSAAELEVGAKYMVFETTTDEATEALFYEALALLHNFEYNRAAEKFKAAQQSDPDFVMAYWGEAMTHNHPLWEQQDREAALEVLARLGATPQDRAAKARNPREAMWLDAVETLYGTDGSGASKHERDFLYLAKMHALFDSDPSDIDARAFTGLATLGTAHGGRDTTIYMTAAGLLEQGFITHQKHPGILHYLIHSYDDPTHAPLGERAAERYAKVAPNAGHAQHMISHIFHALGDWEASEKANTLADAVVDRQLAAAGRDPSNCGHYNEWLIYALVQQGKDASGMVAACRADAEAAIAQGANSRLGSRLASSYGAIANWNGAVTGDWPEPLATGEDGQMMVRFDMATAQLFAAMEAGDLANAQAARAELVALATGISETLAVERPLVTYVAPWLERQVAQSEAIVTMMGGDTDSGMDMLRAAAEAEVALPEVFGPPAMVIPSYELLGEMLLQADKPDAAIEAFEMSLAFAPGRKRSLDGLAQAEGGMR